jgi:hypothetical protein
LKGLQADTTKALVEEQRTARTRLKGKQRTKGENIKSTADDAMDALLRELAPSGTPAAGAESGTLNASSGTTSAAGEPSASGSAGSTERQSMPSTASRRHDSADAGASDVAMSAKAEEERPCDQFRGGDGEEDDL